jgi:RHS repeat-associated protein
MVISFGNREEMTTGAGTTTYAYDDADRLTEVDPPAASPVAYTWDDNGNLTDRGADAFAWDYEDRMTSATVNSVTTNFVYRGDGLRDSRAVSGGATTTFTWDIASGLPVVLDDGKQYVYGAGLTSMKQAGNWYYYLADGLGSTMAVVDSAGNSQKSYTYDVYGEATPSGGLTNEFDFAGQQTDGTGLQYLRARYYDPETGTFLSREPLAKDKDWLGNSYSYAICSPVVFSDPTGLFPSGKERCAQKLKDVRSALGKLRQRIAERNAAPIKDKGHAKSIEQAAKHLQKEMFRFGSWPDNCRSNKHIRPDDFDENEWEEAERLVEEYAPQKANILDKVKEVISNPPEVPDYWWDGDPFDPWRFPAPWRFPGRRGPIIN